MYLQEALDAIDRDANLREFDGAPTTLCRDDQVKRYLVMRKSQIEILGIAGIVFSAARIIDANSQSGTLFWVVGGLQRFLIIFNPCPSLSAPKATYRGETPSLSAAAFNASAYE